MRDCCTAETGGEHGKPGWMGWMWMTDCLSWMNWTGWTGYASICGGRQTALQQAILAGGREHRSFVD